MALLRILIYGDERLHVKSERLQRLTPELRQLIADMGETMYAANGAGLAAPQIGVHQRVFVLDVDQVDDDGKKSQPRRLRVFINAEILWSSDEDVPYVEGCLSIPGVEAEVDRPARVRVRYRDEHWTEHEEEAEGLLARVIQHELDHLDGILFVDRLGFLKRQSVAAQLRHLRKEHETIYVPAELAAK
jgi:peptide deformylase